ncbi:MAG: GNAT family N-acetyltransferase [Actinomycetota bacterium]
MGNDTDHGRSGALAGLGAFRTARLRLRPMTADDFALLAVLNGDDEVMRHITGRALNAEETRRDLDRSLGTRWLLFDPADDRFLGWVAAAPHADGVYEIGWRLCRQAWGHGYATEAARAIVYRAFAAGASRVFAETMAVNRRSRSVMERIDLRHVRTFHLDVDDPLPGTDEGEVEYALTRHEWERDRTGT